jgi:proteasome lid subunit RPN8/RPN11
MNKQKPVEFIQHVLSTIILDAVQFFPQNKKKVQYEAHGLIFGIDKEKSIECDYAFPIGSVEKRSDVSVMPDSKVDYAVKAAKELFSTSNCIATYHSHPYEEPFEGWANPSNGDCGAADYLKLPYFIIIAIARNGKKDQPFDLFYSDCDAYGFSYNPKVGGHEYPYIEPLDYEVSYVHGEFQKYTFTIRAYKNTGKSLVDVDLFSSEAELMMILNDENINLRDLSTKETNRLRKMEYNLREENREKGQRNFDYHLGQIK